MIAGTFITVLVAWDLFGTLPPPLGVVDHKGSTVFVGLNVLPLPPPRVWPDSREARPCRKDRRMQQVMS